MSLCVLCNRCFTTTCFRSYRARRKPLLTPQQKAKRFRFAKKYATWDAEDWRHVLWSDEATFKVTGSGYQRVYRPPHADPHDPKYTVQTVKHPDRIMVWGCFTYCGVVTLVVLPKNVKVNRGIYLKLCDHLSLPDSFEPTRAKVFMQDGAPYHTAHSVIQWQKDCKESFFNDWSGNSPDINPIENLWALLK